MSSDLDESLVAELQAFGQTLDSEGPTSIRHPTSSAEADNSVVAIPTTRAVHPSRSTRRPILLAAAAVLVLLMGAAIWSTNNDSSFQVEPAHDSTTAEQTTDADETSSESDTTVSTKPDEATETPQEVISNPQPASFVGPDGDPVGVYEGDSHPMVQQAIVELLDNDYLLGGKETTERRLANDGLTIFTSFDSDSNALAERTLNERFPLDQRNGFDVQIVTLDTRSGAITSFASTNSNEELQTSVTLQRKPGSAFKPLALAALFEDGYQPNDQVRADGPCRFSVRDSSKDYEVGGSPSEATTIATATTDSNNCAFVRLGSVVGNGRVAETARSLGISTLPPSINEVLSLPLGVFEVRPLQMAGAYAAFANDGKKVTPHFVSRIEDRNGDVLFSRPAPSKQVVSTQTARMINEILESNIERGTGKRAQLETIKAAGKTGTTNHLNNAWFVGYAGGYATAVWLGDLEDLRQIDLPESGPYGGQLPAQIWGAYMEALLEDSDPVDFRTDYDAAGLREPQLLTAENETS